MAMDTIQVSREAARRFHRRAVLLDAPVADIGAALDHLGYVQFDPINVCGRKLDSILCSNCSVYLIRYEL